MHKTCGHLRHALNRDEADILFAKCIGVLEPLTFDTFAFSGNSGALVAPVMAHKLQKEMIMVRKPDVTCASSFPVEGFEDAQKYVIIDDMVASGSTTQRIVRGVQRFSPQARCVGLLLYNWQPLLYLPGSSEFDYLMRHCPSPFAITEPPVISKMPVEFAGDTTKPVLTNAANMCYAKHDIEKMMNIPF